MNHIKVTQKCVISGGETIDEVVAYTCEGYDVIRLTLAPSASDVEVDLQAGGAGQVSLLAIMTPNNVYPADIISYKINGDGENTIYLNNMHMFVGVGAIKALQLVPTKLYLSNEDDAVAKAVKILVGRDATP